MRFGLIIRRESIIRKNRVKEENRIMRGKEKEFGQQGERLLKKKFHIDKNIKNKRGMVQWTRQFKADID